MYLIVGLGNPESDYANTRHNMGFDVINEISKKCDIKVSKSKFNALYGMGEIENNKVILVKPQTYMNLSGESIIQFKKFYKISNKNIIVIYDDIDLKIGDMINYVIGPIPKREKEILDGSIEKAAESVIEILKSGIDVAMNRFN